MNSSNTFRKLRKAGKRFVQLRSFIRSPKKHFYRFENPAKLPFFFLVLFRQSRTKVLGHLHFRDVFQFIQVQPSPHPTNNVRRVYPEFPPPPPRVGVGRTARKFRKGCSVLRGNREMTEKYEDCSTVPGTFVQDCRYLQVWSLIIILLVRVYLKYLKVKNESALLVLQEIEPLKRRNFSEFFLSL